MNALKNKVQVIGRLGVDPIVKTFEVGKCMARFSLAVSENYKDKNGQWQSDTNWFNVVAWGGKAEYIEKNIAKGDQIMIQGKLISRSYDDQEGIKRTSTEIVANDLMVIQLKDKKES